MRKFILIISVTWVSFYTILWTISKITDYSNHREYLSYMKIIEEIEKENDNFA